MLDKILKFFWRKSSDISDISPTYRYIHNKLVVWGNSIVELFYDAKNFSSVHSINCRAERLPDSEVLDIVSIAFNQPKTIEWQIKFLKRNLNDKFFYTVADNSLDPAAAREIESVCARFGVGYIRLPKNPYNGRLANLSHGLALNWVYRNFISRRGAAYFAFLDHDIMPVGPVSVLPILKERPVYGALHTRGRYWYLWPGFCFFRSDIFYGRRVNFSLISITTLRTHVSFDTGSGNWFDIYARMNRAAQVREARYRFALLNGSPAGDRPFDWLEGRETIHENYDNGDLGASDKLIEFIDNWLHLRRIGYGDPEAIKQKLNRLSAYFYH